MKKTLVISVLLTFTMSHLIHSQDLKDRKDKLLRFVEGIKRIPVRDELRIEKENKIGDLIKKIEEILDANEIGQAYSEFEKVRMWLLTNATEKPFFSDEELQEEGELWRIRNSVMVVEVDKRSIEILVKSNDAEWRFSPTGSDDIILEDMSISLNTAKNIEVEPLITGYSKGFIIKFSEFPGLPNFYLYLTIHVSKDCLICEISCSDVNKKLYEVRFPKPIVLDRSEKEYSVLPLMQGALLFSNYPRAFFNKDLCNTRTMYMPWWAHIKGRSAVVGIIATTDDAGVIYEHPAGGPTKVQPVWYASMGELKYLRRIEYYFMSESNYVSVAKKYRSWAMEHGNFVSMKEKISRCPILAKITGVPVIHTGALYHIEKLSSYYVEHPVEDNHKLQTFEEIECKLKTLKEKGLDSAYVHLDGWGYLGYDSSHPDTVPVGHEAGGVNGLRKLSKTCQELNYILALHDNYFDCYWNGISSNLKLAVQERNGIITQYSVWCGGPEALLSPKHILPYWKKNYEWLNNEGVEIQGVYLDVFSVASLIENYLPFSPVSRAECAKYRLDSFRYLKNRGYIVSSEEPTDLYVPVLDLVHHGPYYLDGSFENGEKVGIPVPLFNLVYHDAIIIPWSFTEDGGWGIPKGDAGYLHCVLNAGMPYLSIDAEKEEIEKIKEFCRLQAHCQSLEMINHEFLDSSFRKQRTTFADGTKITVDFDSKTYEIQYP
ncbi:MAG: DUF5696 domain-containing protein, partial [Candidatus Hydrogenedentes bacterium]|nr:DUF5696 domain-containing protein [Candidatus Hydrogenedentota bacterium]